jgi:hypothetical protein
LTSINLTAFCFHLEHSTIKSPLLLPLISVIWVTREGTSAYVLSSFSCRDSKLSTPSLLPTPTKSFWAHNLVKLL